jgi:hypothetical protein
MSDFAESAEAFEQRHRDAALEKARRAAAEIPAGEPGDCELCGEWSGRLVNGACAPCRDRYKLK